MKAVGASLKAIRISLLKAILVSQVFGESCMDISLNISPESEVFVRNCADICYKLSFGVKTFVNAEISLLKVDPDS